MHLGAWAWIRDLDINIDEDTRIDKDRDNLLRFARMRVVQFINCQPDSCQTYSFVGKSQGGQNFDTGKD